MSSDLAGSPDLSGSVLPEDRTSAARARARVHRHLQWVRRDGLARMVEEDGLDPRERIRAAVRARRWRAEHAVPIGTARPVFVMGVQRSGTNMVLRGLEQDPAVETHNENDHAAFERFQLRRDEQVRAIVHRSRHEVVLFKPLCDSHRAAELLASLSLPGLPVGWPPRVIWVYRDVDGRARSAVHKFGDVNRRVLAEIARGDGRDRWQSRGLSEATLRLVREARPDRLSPESAAALFWVVRNRLFFDQGLHLRPDVHLVSYERFVLDPEEEGSALARFVGLQPGPHLWEHADARALSTPRLDIDPLVRRAADQLEVELALVAERCFRRTRQVSTR